MAVDDLFTVDVRYLADARRMSSIFAYRATFSEAMPDLSRSLDRAFNNDIVPLLLDVWTTEVQLLSTYVLGINPAGRIPSVTYQTADFGTIVSDTFPNNRPYVLKQVTDAPNAKHNGRIYMSGFGDVNTTAQNLNLAFQTGVLADLVTGLEGTIADPDEITRIWQPVVVNRVVLGIPVIPPSFFDVVNVISSNIIYSQRRRVTVRDDSPA